MKEDLLDLYGLSIKLKAISEELGKTEDPKRITLLASSILEPLELELVIWQGGSKVDSAR
jgi:hypothetical protein